ncbi:MAG: hypothetical protein ABH883_09075 [Candidatus Omnitrophota bacterium]
MGLKFLFLSYPETEPVLREVCSLLMNVKIAAEEAGCVISAMRSSYKK